MTRKVCGSILSWAALAAFALCGLTQAEAQQTLGSMNGTVTDSTGAAIANAVVTISDPDINVTRIVTAGSNGYFQIFNLPIGRYKLQATHAGFDTVNLIGIEVQEAHASTLNIALRVGHEETAVEVNANPLLNATDTTNGYTLDNQQIELTPLATGSFTQLAVLSPGVNTELLSGVGSQAGLGNQPIWANGQRDTSNTFQVNGVDVTNLFNGKTASNQTSQRDNFNIGGGSTGSLSASGAANIGGASLTSTSSYGSNGNSLPSPPQEFLSELRVNTSMYDAQQGATSGAQIDVATQSGTNKLHGQIFGTYANNYLNADPYFFKQDAILAQSGIGAFPQFAENPDLHRWTTGATIGGPIKKDKLFFFIGYQHLYDSDQGSAISQLQVPTGLTNDRTDAGLVTAYQSWNKGSTAAPPALSSIARQLFNAKLPNGRYLIPSATPGIAYAPSIPNVTLVDTSRQVGDMATASLDYQVSTKDRLSAKYYYQNAPTVSPFSYQSTGGFPGHQANLDHVGALDNAIQIGSKLNWEQRLGFSRMASYSYLDQLLPTDPLTGSPTYGISQGAGTSAESSTLPGLAVAEFGYNSSASQGLKVGPYSYFNNLGYYQNRLNPSTNVIWSLGKHTILAGGGYNYTQLNVINNRNLLPETEETSFKNFYDGAAPSGSHSGELSSIVGNHNNADRYYRSNESDAYVQDKFQILSNLTITAGVRWDYHGGLTEKYGNLANFDPTTYDVIGTTATGFTVNNSGFVIAGNSANATPGATDSTLHGRQWGISPRVGFAWAPKRDNGTFVVRGGFGLYYDRGELFQYLSQPAGNGSGGPFGTTESAPFTTFSTKVGPNLGSALLAPTTPTGATAAIKSSLQSALNGITGVAPDGLQACSGLDSQVSYQDCGQTLNFGAYGPDNTLPYTMNATLNVQWQPSQTIAVTFGYTGNRGRKLVVPIPFNEPQIATPANPGMVLGKSTHPSGETQSYGMDVLDLSRPSPYTSYGDPTYNPIPGEYWNTLDGGNTDLRAPYIGFSPNSALFKTVGTSAYDALETHIEKRMSHNVQLGASYTFSHTLDEQSDIGLFFTGDDPAKLKDSYSSADFDRTHVLSANFLLTLPNLVRAHSLLAQATNGWNMSGIAILQSGEPYSLYEFYGAVGSIRFGNYPTLMNPVLPVKDKNAALTGHTGANRPGGNYQPAIDPSQIAIQYLQPGEQGVPVETNGGPQDTYETGFLPGQRNIFRQAPQRQLNLSFRKDFKLTERFDLQGQFNVFNITNTSSFDVPQNQAQIRQDYACATSNPSACSNETLNYGQIGATAADQATNNGRGTAGSNLDLIPTHSGAGASTIIPYTSSNANFGSVTGTIGSSRLITWGFRLTY